MATLYDLIDALRTVTHMASRAHGNPHHASQNELTSTLDSQTLTQRLAIQTVKHYTEVLTASMAATRQYELAASNGLTCPNCHSTDVEGAGYLEVAGGAILGRMRCTKCLATWVSNLSPVGYTGLVLTRRS